MRKKKGKGGKSLRVSLLAKEKKRGPNQAGRRRGEKEILPLPPLVLARRKSYRNKTKEESLRKRTKKDVPP